MSRKILTVKGVDIDAIEMLAELREEERRYAGAILSDAIREYWLCIFDDPDTEAGEEGHDA